MTAGFGGAGYNTPQQRALSSIQKSPTADTSSQEKMAELLQRHSAQLKFLAANQKQLQQGVNDATANPIQQVQQFIADVIVLLGGGQLAAGALDFGDLQYILPALGALFGFDADAPFPISLFEAAERFFLGYVVPNAQFADVIIRIIEQWASVFGIDPEFIADVRELIEAFGSLFDGLQNLLPSLNELFGALGITGGDLGPLGQALAPIIKLFSGIDLENFGDAIEFITDAISPFIEQLTAIINFINSILAVLGYDGGDVVNSPLGDLTNPFTNLMALLGNLNFASPDFDIGDAWISIVTLIGNVIGIPNLIDVLLNIPGLDTVLGWFGLDPGGDETDLIALISSFLRGDSPLNALNIFGNLPSYLLGEVPASALGSASPNLLSNAGFEGAISMDASGGWVWDDANGHTSPGCAKTTAEGTLKALQSNGIAVTPNQDIDLAVWMQTTSYGGAGTPIKLGVRTFLDGVAVGNATIAQRGATPSWTKMSGTYTVPASGVDSIRLRLVVDTGATSGTIRFDDAEVRKPGNGPFDGLLSLFGLSHLNDFLGLDPTSVWSTIVTTVLNPLSLLEDGGIREFVKGMIDQLTSILRLVPFVGPTLGDSLESFAEGMDAQNSTVIGTAASLSQLAAAMGQGTPDADDFERTTLGSNWRVITRNGGSVTVNGHDLVMSHDSADTDYILLKTDKQASGDYQTSEITLGSAPDWGTVLVDTARAHNDIWLRCSNFTTWAGRTGIRCRWTAQNNNVEISGWVNGSKVVTIYSGALQAASSGSRLMLECGVLGVPRRYVVRINGSVAKEVDEAGTASQLGASYRYRGLGGATEVLGIPPFGITPDPGRVKGWTATG